MTDSKFVLTQGAGHKLEKAIVRNGGGMRELEWLSKGENFKQVIRLASGEAELLMKPALVTETATSFHTLVIVDPSTPLVYPEWAVELLEPGFERTRYQQYDLSQLGQYLHAD